MTLSVPKSQAPLPPVVVFETFISRIIETPFRMSRLSVAVKLISPILAVILSEVHRIK